MEKSEEKSGILSGAAWLTFSVVLVKVIGMLYKIPMSYILTDEGMGYFNAAYTIYSMLYLLGTAGVPKAITVLISAHMAEGNAVAAARIFSVARKFFLILGFLLFLVLIFFAGPISLFIGCKNAYPTICMIAPCLIFVALGGAYRGYLAALNEFSCSAVSSVIEAGAKLFLGLFFLWVGIKLSLPLPWLCAISSLGIAVGTLGSTVYLHINIKNQNKSKKTRQKVKLSQSRDVIQSIVKIALPITLGSVAGGLGGMIDLSMIMRRLEASGHSVEEATALYGNYTTLAVPMLQLATALLSPIGVVLLPKLTYLFNSKDGEALDRAVRFGSQLCGFISFPIACAFLFFPYSILSFIFPSQSAMQATSLLQLLSPGVLIFALLLIANTVLEASGGFRLQMLSMVIGIITKMVVSRILLADPRFGISGAPIGTTASYAASFVFSCICLHRRGSRVGSLWMGQMPCALNALAASFAALSVQRIFGVWLMGRPLSAVVFLVFSAVYLALSYFCGVLGYEKIQILSKQTKNAV